MHISHQISLRSRPMITSRTRYNDETSEIIINGDPDDTDDQTELLPKHANNNTRISSSTTSISSPTSHTIRSISMRFKLFLISLPRIIFVLITITIFLLLDRLIRQPHGIISLRWLLGWSKYDDSSTPCGWDYEASWKIGIAAGTNPMTIEPSNININNPILTCQSLPSHIMNTSFVADPFLVLTPKHDKNDAIRPVDMPLSFESVPSYQIHLSNTSMYVFYEYKNLANGLGEIGVSSSNDAGRSFHFEGIALTESHLHLSYPIIFYERERDIWIMIPETSMNQSVRIYTTSVTSFPLGWTLHSTPLKGHRFVDTSPIFYQNQWVIFTTYDDSLHVYQTASLIDESKPWIEHPMSPVVRKDRRYARSGGRPFLFDGKIHRVAQDDRAFYGARVYIIEVDVLSSIMYQETIIRTIEPESMDNELSPWSSERLHQLDAHQIAAQQWIALLDGDDKPDDYQFDQREGWFRSMKFIALIVSSAVTTIALLLVIRPSLPCIHSTVRSFKQFFSTLNCLPQSFTRSYSRPAWMNSIIGALESLKLFLMSWRLMVLFLALFVVSFAFTALVLVPHFPIMGDGESGLAFRNPTIEQLDEITQQTPGPLPPNVRARFVPDNTSVAVNPYYQFNAASAHDLQFLSFPHNSASFALPPSLHSIGSSFVQPSAALDTLTYYPVNGLMLITAASSAYFDRLQNFVGSLHFWEPSQTVFIYDLGLTYEQAAEVRCWQRVNLLSFPFERYPMHVRNLYNYAWKTLMIDDAFHYHNASSVLVLDSGVELRRPFALSSIKSSLVERGYWLARQSNTVDAKTVPETLVKLSIDPAVVRGKTFCAGGLNGFTRSAAAYTEIVQPAIQCALDESCISPVGSGRKTHNFDQSVISALVYASGRRCSPSRLYREWDLSLVTTDETNYNDIVFFLRRWHEPKPYIRHIKQTISNQCGYVPALKRAQRTWVIPPPESVKELNLTKSGSLNQLESMLIQHRDGRHLESDSPLVRCLHRFNNSRVACVDAIDAYITSVSQLGSSKSHSLRLSVDARGFSMLHRVRAVNVWLVAFVVTVFIYWLLMRFKRPPVSPTCSNRSVGLLVALIVVLTAGYPMYIDSLNDHGTFSPFVALHLTKPYTMQQRIRPSQTTSHRPRVVFTMSTLPHQVEFINETLDSLAAQSIKPDTIYINLPNFNHRTNQSYEPPAMLLQGHWNGVPLVVNRGEDIGPLTKLAPTLLVENEPDTIVISCDTDKQYPSELLSTLLRFTEADPTAAWGVCGWGFLFRPAPVGVLPVYIPWALRGSEGRQVDVLQAVCGNAYRRSMFPATNTTEMTRFMSPHPACFTTDDLWIAGWLATRSGDRPVPQVLIPGGLTMWSAASPEPTTASWKAAQGSMWDLSSINKAAGIDAACLRGVEQSLGPWRTRREQ